MPPPPEHGPHLPAENRRRNAIVDEAPEFWIGELVQPQKITRFDFAYASLERHGLWPHAVVDPEHNRFADLANVFVAFLRRIGRHQTGSLGEADVGIVRIALSHALVAG